LRAGSKKSSEIKGRREHDWSDIVDAVVFYQSLCNRVFGMDPERFPSPDLGIAAGREKNFDKLCDCSRLVAVHFPYLSAVQLTLNRDYESQTTPPEGGTDLRKGQSFWEARGTRFEQYHCDV